MASYYLDDMNVEPGDIVVCTANIASPWVKCGEEFVVRDIRAGHCAIESRLGATILNPSARFKPVVDLLGMQVIESQWRDGYDG